MKAIGKTATERGTSASKIASSPIRSAIPFGLPLTRSRNTNTVCTVPVIDVNLPPQILLAGARLARSPNILDANHAEPTLPLPPKQRSVLSEQALQFMPCERHAFALVLPGIGTGTGNDMQEELLDAVRASLPPEWNIMVRSHLTDIAVRLVDISLLTRNWQGRHVRYKRRGDTKIIGQFQRALEDADGAAHAQ